MSTCRQHCERGDGRSCEVWVLSRDVTQDAAVDVIGATGSSGPDITVTTSADPTGHWRATIPGTMIDAVGVEAYAVSSLGSISGTVLVYGVVGARMTWA